MSVEEASKGFTQLGSELGEGINVLSLGQTVTFTLYVKLVLPLDGYVFWVNANLLKDSAIYGISQFAKLEYGQPDNLKLPEKIISVKGSLHYATELIQKSDDVGSRNSVTFTTQEQVQDFNLVGTHLRYIANFDGIRFAFSRTANYYKQANVYHYRGDAIYSTMASQIIDNLKELDIDNVIVSNSLPLWLTLNKFFPIYPAFLNEQNQKLPYATIDIDPKNTIGLQSAPLIYIDSSHYQLVKDTVKIQMYGVRNAQALEFQDYIFNYSRNTDNFGVMSIPVMQDEHVTQKELGIIAQKKTFTIDISYHQANILDIAQKYILSALITLIPI